MKKLVMAVGILCLSILGSAYAATGSQSIQNYTVQVSYMPEDQTSETGAVISLQTPCGNYQQKVNANNGNPGTATFKVVYCQNNQSNQNFTLKLMTDNAKYGSGKATFVFNPSSNSLENLGQPYPVPLMDQYGKIATTGDKKIHNFDGHAVIYIPIYASTIG